MYNYLNKQIRLYPKRFYDVRSVLIDWYDYINDCEKLKYELTPDITLPSDLVKAHEKTIKKIKYKEDKSLNLKIKNRITKELQRFCFQSEKFFIRPAKDSVELLKEGRELKHCVGGYSQRYADGQTNLFVLRKVTEPDVPFYTVEIKQGYMSKELEILQCRSFRNYTPEMNKHQDVIDFLEEFKKEKLTKKSKQVPA